MPALWYRTAATSGDLLALVRAVETPTHLLLDRLGLKRHEYLLRFEKGGVVSVRPGTGDRFTVFETFVRDCYGEALRRISANAIVIDVGANIGCFTLRAAQTVGPHGLVIAVEPQEENCSQLRRNLALNGLGNVEVAGCALAGSAGMRRFRTGGSGLFASFHDEVNGMVVRGADVDIEAMTLEDLCVRHHVARVDLLKLDCEGAEYEVLFALSDSFLSKISRVVAELHALPGWHPKQLVQYLVGKGFRHGFDGLHHFHRE